jgi:hypothetical protein
VAFAIAIVTNILIAKMAGDLFANAALVCPGQQNLP